MTLSPRILPFLLLGVCAGQINAQNSRYSNGHNQHSPGFGGGNQQQHPGFVGSNDPGFGGNNGGSYNPGFGGGNQGGNNPGFGGGNQGNDPGFGGGNGNYNPNPGFGGSNGGSNGGSYNPGFGGGNNPGFGGGHQGGHNPGFGGGNNNGYNPGFGGGNDPGFGGGNNPDQKMKCFTRWGEERCPREKGCATDMDGNANGCCTNTNYGEGCREVSNGKFGKCCCSDLCNVPAPSPPLYFPDSATMSHVSWVLLSILTILAILPHIH